MSYVWRVGLVITSALPAVVATDCNRKQAPRDPAPASPQSSGVAAMHMTVTSDAFRNGKPIPKRFAGDGDDVSPSLRWSKRPDGVKELALIVDDPDAPTPEPWVHWVIYKIPPDTTGLAENVARSASPGQPPGAVQGKNSWGGVGYQGPAPPPGHGVHHYHFKLYALDAALDVSPGLTKRELLSAMSGRIIAQGELVGTYER